MGRSLQRYVNLQAKMAPRIRSDRRQQKPQTTYRETQRYIDEHNSRQEAQTFTEAVKEMQNFHVEPGMTGDGNPYVALALTLTALGGFAIAPSYVHAESPEKSRASGDNQPVKDMVAKIAKLKTDYRTNMADGQLSEGEKAQILTDAIEVRNDPTLQKHKTFHQDVGASYKQLGDDLKSMGPYSSCNEPSAIKVLSTDAPQIKSGLQPKDINNVSEKIDSTLTTRIGTDLDELNTDLVISESAAQECIDRKGVGYATPPLGQSPSYSGEPQEQYTNGLIAMLKSLETDLTNSSKNLVGKYWSQVAGKAFSTDGERAAAVLQELETHDDPTKHYWDSSSLWNGPYDIAKQNDTPTLEVNLPDGKTRTPYTGSVVIKDESGDIVEAKILGPSWASWDPVTGKITGTPDRSQTGEQYVKISTKDSHGNVAELNETIDIVSDNNLPGVDNAPLDKVYTRSEFKWKPNVSDADGDVLSVGLVSGPDGMTYDEKTGEVKWTPNRTQVGAYKFKVAVSDGFDTIEKEYAIQSESDNAKPVVVVVGSTSLRAGQTGEILFSASDKDNDPLAHNVSLTNGKKDYRSALKVTKDGNNVRVEINTTSLPVGKYTLRDKVSDGYPGGEVDESREIEILKNNPPAFPQPGFDFEVVKGEQVNYQFQATDDSGVVAYYEAVGNLPPGLVLQPDGKLSGKPTKEGKWGFKVAAVDEQGLRAERTVFFESYAENSADGNFLGMAAALAVALGTVAVVGYAARDKIAEVIGRKKRPRAPPADGVIHTRDMVAELEKPLTPQEVAKMQKEIAKAPTKEGGVPAYLTEPVSVTPKKAEFKGLYLMKEDGRLMAAWYTGERGRLDPDLFASQFTAIAQFGSDSGGGEAEEIIQKGKRVFVRHGQGYRIVIETDNGSSDASHVKGQADKFVESIDENHSRAIARWSGQVNDPILDDLQVSTEKKIRKYFQQDSARLHRTFDELPQQTVESLRKGTYVGSSHGAESVGDSAGELGEISISRKRKEGNPFESGTDRVIMPKDIDVNKLGKESDEDRRIKEMLYGKDGIMPKAKEGNK